MLSSSGLAEPVESTQALAHQASFSCSLPAIVGRETSAQLLRMFRDPRVLEQAERKDLITQLRHAVELMPEAAEVRVLYGMALCVDFQAQEALEQLRAAVDQAPDSFMARLKYGELLMRLRICDKAAEETHRAAVLAANAAQSELARRQATTIRTMLREGIERGGYKGLLSRMLRPRRKLSKAESMPALVTTK